MSTDLIKIVVPQSTTNLVTNPSFETGTTSWNTHLLSTISQSTEQSRWGRYSLKVEAASSQKSGAKTDNFTNLSGDDIVVSAWVHAPNGQDMRLIIHDVDLASDVTTTTFTGTGAWQRVEAVNTSFTATNDMYILIGADDAGAPTFYVDGVMYEEWPTEGISVATTYCDGDQEACEWTGIDHASTSTRDGDTRAGGQILNLDANANLKVRHIDGFGVLPYSHRSQPTPLLPGAIFQNVHAEPRVLTILMASTTTDRATYHTAREQLVDRLKHHATTSVEPVKIIYDDTREVEGYYDAGLEAVLDGPYLEQFALRFICYDPYWREIGEVSTDLSTGTIISSNYIVMRRNGDWDDMDTGTNNLVRAVAYHPSRKSYFIGGDFTQAGSGPTTVNYVAEYTPSTDTWAAMDTGTNGAVHAIAIGPDNLVYVGGAFTQVGSGPTAANRIARWDPSGSSWEAMGSGTSGTVYALGFEPSNELWIGGDFTTAGGTTVNNITQFVIDRSDPPVNADYNAIDSGVNGIVRALDSAGEVLIVGGDFTTAGAGATTVNRVAKWHDSDAAWSALGSGFASSVRAVKIAQDRQTIYAAGQFSAENYISVWNGTAWSEIAGGLESNVNALAIDSQGSIWVGGEFDDADGNTRIIRLARIIGNSWVPTDIRIAQPTANYVNAINVDRDDTMILGLSIVESLGTSLLTTVTNNGTAKAFPQIVVENATVSADENQGHELRIIRNETTGHELFFDLPIGTRETLTIDLRPEVKDITSNIRNYSSVYGVLPASDWSGFCLAPGANEVSFLSSVGTVSAVWIKWRDTYESFD